MKQRIWELDALRGVAILCVILVHLVFDLTYFLSLPLRLGPVFDAVQEYGGTVFVVLSGLCATLGSRSFRRGLIVFACGMLITVVTLVMARLGLAADDIIIWFGVLHLLGVCMMLYPLLKRLDSRVLALLCLVTVPLGYVLMQRRFAVTWLFPLGILSPSFSSGDYFPLLPYLGWFCLGVVLGRTLYREKRSLLPKVRAEAAPLRFLCWCGRHSLWIYLLHQPLLFGLTELLSAIRG